MGTDANDRFSLNIVGQADHDNGVTVRKRQMSFLVFLELKVSFSLSGNVPHGFCYSFSPRHFRVFILLPYTRGS
jgi:hypothetical protein